MSNHPNHRRQQTQLNTPALPRGIRNNNPGNIRHSAANWVGIAPQQNDPSFLTFDTPEHGIRAIARILVNYQTHHHLHTTREIINRWAPPSENLTDAYIHAVATAAGVDPNARIDLRHNISLMTRFVSAITNHENGSPHRFGRQEWYDPAILRRGVTMALGSPAHPHEDRSHRHHRHRHHHVRQQSASGTPPQIAPSVRP